MKRNFIDNVDIKNIKYLLFVGSGRTGSTLVGQLLNQHPEILISNEERILNKCLDENQKISQFFYKIKNSAMNDYIYGSLKYEREFNSVERAKKWQKDWKPISGDDKVLKSKNLKYIGDKKQGGNSSILRSHPNILSLIDISFIPISIIRHPHQVFQSYINVGLEKNEASNKTINDLLFGLDFVKKHNGVYFRYEDILENTDLWCDKISSKLELMPSNNWKELVRKTVTLKKQNYNTDESDLTILKKTKGYNRLINEYFKK
jgi:hypothetical protein